MQKSTFVACLLLTGAMQCGAAEARSCSAPELLNTITMAPVAGSDLMTVPVTINGKQKQFLLDTGDDTTQVSEAMVRDLGLPEHTYMGGARELNVRGSHKADDAREQVEIAELAMGNQKGSGFQFLVSQDRELGRDKPYDGLLANDLFSNYDVDMDFVSRELKYFGSSHCAGQVVYWPQRPIAVVPVTLRDRKIYVPVTLDGHQIDAVIDTSAARTIIRRDIADVVLNLRADTPEMTRVDDLRDGHSMPVYAHTIQLLSFEGLAVQNLAALVQTNSMVRNRDSGPTLASRAQSTDPRIPDLTIGMDVLHQLHVYIAFGEKKLYVTAAGSGQTGMLKTAAPGQ